MLEEESNSCVMCDYELHLGPLTWEEVCNMEPEPLGPEPLDEVKSHWRDTKKTNVLQRDSNLLLFWKGSTLNMFPPQTWSVCVCLWCAFWVCVCVCQGSSPGRTWTRITSLCPAAKQPQVGNALPVCVVVLLVPRGCTLYSTTFQRYLSPRYM